MLINHLLEELESHEPYQFAEPLSSVFIYALSEPRPFAQPLLVDSEGRTLCWILKPGESILSHQLPSSTFYMVVLKGRGVFVSSNETEQEFGPNTLLIFEPNEVHSVHAIDEEMIVVGFVQAIAVAQPDQCR